MMAGHIGEIAGHGEWAYAVVAFGTIGRQLLVGDLEAGKGGAPSFLVWAAADPQAMPLQRVQVIKGWLDEDGETHERIYDIAVSDGRTVGSDGRARQPG